MSIPVHVDRDSHEPLYRQVERQFRSAIEARRLRPGQRVPSVRVLATELDVGRLTIATAYEQLAADGYLVARVGFGTIVAPGAPDGFGVDARPGRPRRAGKRPPIDAPPTLAGPEPWVAGGVAPRFDLRPGPLGGPGMAAGPALERVFRDAWRELGGSAQGGTVAAAGDPLLRETIASLVRSTRGGQCEAAQVVVLSGALTGMAAVGRLWLGAGRGVAIEDPADPTLRRAVELDGAQVVAVPVDRGGLRLDALPERAAVIVVSPTVQALTGFRMPLARRLRLLAWAAAAGAIVVEDAQLDGLVLAAPPEPSLHGLDDDGRVVHLGAFASILHPGVRMGYAIVPADLVDPFAACVAGLDPGVTPVQQRAIGRFLADGHFERHLARVRRTLSDRHEAAAAAVRRELGWLASLEPVVGGARAVITVEDDRWTATAVCTAALEAGVAISPLASVVAPGGPDRQIVLDVGRHEPAELRQAVRLLSSALTGRGATATSRPPGERRRAWSFGRRPEHGAAQPIALGRTAAG
jgi:GntR family transcriptional regulator/MocR family aminotransferase